MTTITFTQDELFLLGSSVLQNLFAWNDNAETSGESHAIKTAGELNALWEKIKAEIQETP
jgi:hypothetical protein